MTEAQLMYKKPPGEAYKVDNDIKANIRFIKGSHFTLGSGNGGIGVDGGSGGNGANGGNGGIGGANAGYNPGAEHFVTLNERTYQQRTGEIAKLSKDVQADLRKSHFQVGGVSEPMVSTNQRMYTDKSKESDFQRAKPMALRQTHFTLGTGKADYTTMHMLNYRDPKLA